MKTDKRVQKFRSIEEMNNAPELESRTPDFERFLRHCMRYWAIAPKQYPRGVFKFRASKRHKRLVTNTTGREKEWNVK